MNSTAIPFLRLESLFLIKGAWRRMLGQMMLLGLVLVLESHCVTLLIPISNSDVVQAKRLEMVATCCDYKAQTKS
jgi:hypothetical protein